MVIFYSYVSLPEGNSDDNPNPNPSSDHVQERGITFSKVACLARCNGAHVDAHRADEADTDREATLEAFRKAVMRTCESDAEEENFQVRKIRCSYCPLPVISTYNPIYRMYNSTYNQL